MASVAPRTLALTFATALAGSVTEGVGLVLLLPLLSVAGVNFSDLPAGNWLVWVSQKVLAHSGMPEWSWFPLVLGLFIVTAALRAVLQRSQAAMVHATAIQVEISLSRRAYESVVTAQWGFLVRQRSGRLTHVLTAELRRVAVAISLSLASINQGCLTLLYLAVALKVSAAMTLLMLAMGGALMLRQRHSPKRVQASGEASYESLGEVYAATEEHLLNVKSVKMYNAENRDMRYFADLCKKVAFQAARGAIRRTGSAFHFEMGTLAALGVVIFLALGIFHVQPVAVLFLLAIFSRLMPQLVAIQSNMREVASALPAYDHVLRIEADCQAHAEPKSLEGGAVASVATAPLSLRREFRLEDIWFAYNAGSGRREPEFVLRGVDLPIAAGMLTAVVGPPDAGKSTIVDLINGLLVPTRGRLILDGWPLDRNEMKQWRGQVGYIGQETVLFNQTVRDNLLWARPEATEDELSEALLLAEAGFVYELPGGLESIVGDRGILLSSEQRQRISLARALLRKPTLLILDEATNALDVENEARVLDSILGLIRGSKQGRAGTLSVLMITRRTSAIRRADRIFELENGRITRSGTWKELNPLA
jgi:ATP-binding cassette subfamily C protein